MYDAGPVTSRVGERLWKALYVEDAGPVTARVGEWLYVEDAQPQACGQLDNCRQLVTRQFIPRPQTIRPRTIYPWTIHPQRIRPQAILISFNLIHLIGYNHIYNNNFDIKYFTKLIQNTCIIIIIIIKRVPNTKS
jgi:hypothetical protein